MTDISPVVIAEAKTEIPPVPEAVLLAANDDTLQQWIMSFRLRNRSLKEESYEEKTEITLKNGKLSICESYVDATNVKNVKFYTATISHIEHALRIWFRSAMLDKHSGWYAIEIAFNIFPSIHICRESLSDEMIKATIEHMLEAVCFLQEIHYH